MCVTSPPFYNLRSYGVEGQIGNETSIDWYLMRLVDIFTEVKRILKNTGSLWVDLGDTFNGSKKGNTNNAQKEGVNEQEFYKGKDHMIPNKSLMLVPERFAIIMVDYGWCLRHKIVHYKRNAMPQSSKDRFSLDYDMLYHFVKQPKGYYFEQQYRPLNKSTMKEIEKAYTGKGIKDYDLNGVQNPSDTKRRILSGFGVGEQKNIQGADGRKPQTKLRFGGNKAAGYGTATYSGKEWTPKTLQYSVPTGKPYSTTIKWKSGKDDDPNQHLHTAYTQRELALTFQMTKEHYDNAIKLGWNPETDDYAEWYFNKRHKKSWHDHSNDDTEGNMQRGQKPPILAFPYGSKLRSVWLPEDQDLIIWDIPTKSFSGAHFATFSEEYVSIPIKATCPPGNGIVLDPFMGAGTTALAALKLGRRFLGIELNEEYIKIANKRLEPFLLQNKLQV